MIGPWLGITLVLALLGVGTVVARHYQRRYLPPPEHSRKLLHVIAGLVGLGLPWLFQAIWPVALLGGIVLLGLLILRRSAGLRHGIGTVIHGVERHSLGDVCFPLGVFLVFVLAGRDHLSFQVAILTLTLADPAAALVGLRYGHHHYRVGSADKTLEGSAAFCIVAFGCAAVSLVGAGGGLPCLAAAAAFAFALTLVEALAPRGLDNLLIPVAGVITLGHGPIGVTWPLFVLPD